jgi:hypothetical protein
MRVIDGWRGEHQMTEPVTDENFYNETAPLLGHVALAWNDCHSVVLSIFHTLSGVNWRNAISRCRSTSSACYSSSSEPLGSLSDRGGFPELRRAADSAPAARSRPGEEAAALIGKSTAKHCSLGRSLPAKGHCRTNSHGGERSCPQTKLQNCSIESLIRRALDQTITIAKPHCQSLWAYVSKTTLMRPWKGSNEIFS